MQRIRLTAIAGILALSGALASGAMGPAFGQAVVSSGESFVDARLLAGRAEADGSRTVALVIDLAPDWKTYWRNPGAAGIPPSFDWQGSRNLADAMIHWPRPEMFDSFGLQTLGYGDQVVFPLHLEPADPGQALDLQLKLSLGVCREICVLEETNLSARIEPAAPGEGADLLASAEAQVPKPGAEQGLISATCRITGAGKKRKFSASLAFETAPEAPLVILEGPDQTWFNGTESVLDAETGAIAVTATLSFLDEAAWVKRSDVRMTVLADRFAADIQGCTAPAG